MFRLLLAIIPLWLLVGCVSTATHEAMTVNSTVSSINPKYKNSLEVRSVKGERVTPGMLTEIRQDEFQKALNASLAQNGLLANSGNSKKYDVDVEISAINQPSMSADVEVSVSIYYTISNATQRKRFLVVGNGYAKFTEYLVAGPRVRFATERAIQNNIKNFIQELDFDK